MNSYPSIMKNRHIYPNRKTIFVMFTIFISSTFLDLEKEREKLYYWFKEVLDPIGMEFFIPIGTTAQEQALFDEKHGLTISNICIFLITPEYGSLISLCSVLKKCPVDSCHYKYSQITEKNQISYTHCEFRFVIEKKIPFLLYYYGNWEIYKEVKSKRWNLNECDSNILKTILSKENSLFEFQTKIKKYQQFAKFQQEIEEQNQIAPGRISNFTNLSRIKNDLALQLLEWIHKKKINPNEFFGRGDELNRLVTSIKNNESILVFGVGGIGKTTIVQLASLILKLEDKSILMLGTKHNAPFGYGYSPFYQKMNQIYLQDYSIIKIAHTIGINNQKFNEDEYLLAIKKYIKENNVLLILDDIHDCRDSFVFDLFESHLPIIAISRKEIYIGDNRIHLKKLLFDDIYHLINLSEQKHGVHLSSNEKSKIFILSEGHPITIEILIRYHHRINFNRLSSFHDVLDFTNSNDIEKWINQIAFDILDGNEKAKFLLKALAHLDLNHPHVIDPQVIYEIEGEKDTFNLLTDVDLIVKRDDGLFTFGFIHLKDALRTNETNYHKWAVGYYDLLYKNYQEPIYATASLFHQVYANNGAKEIENCIIEFKRYSREITPIRNDWSLIIKIGELLSNRVKNNELRLQVLLILGRLYFESNEILKSKKIFENALIDYKKFYENDIQEYFPFLITLFNNLIGVYTRINDIKKAETLIKDESELFEKLIEKKIDVPLIPIADAYITLGTFYLKTGNFKKSEEIYQDALNIFTNFSDSEYYLLEVCKILNNLGSLQSTLGNNDKAKNSLTEAMAILRKLMQKNSKKYLPLYASTLNNLGIIYQNNYEFIEAEDVFQQCLLIRYDLNQKTPYTYIPDIAYTLYNLGILYCRMGDNNKAIKYCQKSLNYHRILVKNDPTVYLPEILRVLINFSSILINDDNYYEAEKYCAEAAEICKNLLFAEPQVYTTEMMSIFINKILIADKNNDDERKLSSLKSLKMYLNSFGIYCNDPNVKGLAQRTLQKYEIYL